LDWKVSKIRKKVPKVTKSKQKGKASAGSGTEIVSEVPVEAPQQGYPAWYKKLFYKVRKNHYVLYC
jgi:hypothetical protein